MEKIENAFLTIVAIARFRPAGFIENDVIGKSPLDRVAHIAPLHLKHAFGFLDPSRIVRIGIGDQLARLGHAMTGKAVCGRGKRQIEYDHRRTHR